MLGSTTSNTHSTTKNTNKMMNLFKVVILLFLSTIAFAQNAVIGYPPDGASVPAGQGLTVQIERPNSLTGSEEVAVVIGLVSCTTSCLPPYDAMGYILYNGPFKPVYHEQSMPPYQNFSVSIPASWTKGSAQLNVAHFTLIGAGPFPYSETFNRSITIV